MIRLKVLIIAHELSPEQGSECAEGWNLVTRLAMYHDIWVLYASGNQKQKTNYKEAVERYFDNNEPLTNLNLIPINQPKLTSIISRINSIFDMLGGIGLPFLYFIGYNFWHKKAYKIAKQLHKENNFDISHQLTQISFREPGYLWKLDIPFIWGPTGGTSTLPRPFRQRLSFVTRILETIRSFSNFYQFNITPRVINANKKASIIYCFTKKDGKCLKKKANGLVKYMLDAGCHVKKDIKMKEPIKLTGLWIGRLMERKSPETLIKAIALDTLTRENISFVIIGNGPLESSLHKLAKDYKLENITWIQKIPHKEIFNIMLNTDFFVHTSIREATTNVIPEALSNGLPVICHDIDGMSIAINDKCGIKIPFTSPEESVISFNSAMKKLIVDKNLVSKLKKGALERAKEISWDSMAKIIATDYSATSKKTRKP